MASKNLNKFNKLSYSAVKVGLETYNKDQLQFSTFTGTAAPKPLTLKIDFLTKVTDKVKKALKLDDGQLKGRRLTVTIVATVLILLFCVLGPIVLCCMLCGKKC